MKWFYKFKIGFVITSLFLALGLFFYSNFPYIKLIIKMLSEVKEVQDFKWIYFLRKEFIFFLIVDLGIIGVFVKKRIGWIMAAFTFYLILVILVISFIFSKGGGSPIWLNITLVVFVAIPIWFLNTKDILHRFKSPGAFVNNLLVFACVGLMFGFMYLTRNV